MKNPVQTAGFWRIDIGEVYRARRSPVPARGAFFDGAAMHILVFIRE